MSADLAVDVVELAACPQSAVSPLPEMAYRGNAWVPAEDAELRALFHADASLGDIVTALGRPRHGVRARICWLGLRRNSARPWLDEEDAELMARYGAEPASAIALDLGRGVPAVYARAAVLKLSSEGAPDYDAWEDAQIRAGYAAAVPVRQIATLIGRTMLGVCCRASLLGVRHPHQPPNWTDAEMARMLELAEEGHRYLRIIEMLVDEGFPRRSKSGFGQRIRIIGYGRGWGRDWTPDEDVLLCRAYAEGGSLVGLAAQLGRTKHSLKWRAEHLELQGTHPKSAGWRGRDWSEADEHLLRDRFGKTPTADLVATLGRTRGAVMQRAHALGLQHGRIRTFTAEERRAIGIVWRLGLPLSLLAKALDRDPAVISKHAIRIGIAFDSPDRPIKPDRGRRKASTSTDRPTSIEGILALLPPDADFDGRLERVYAEREARAKINQGAVNRRRAVEHRERLGLAA